MISLADTHVHLLAGLDDGPPTAEVALAMCRKLVAEGVTHATALAHQNDDYPHNTADRLRTATAALRQLLAEKHVPLSVHPTGEIMLTATTLQDWHAGRLLSVGDHRQWLLVEMPPGQFVDVLPLLDALKPDGVRLIIAHAERYAELLEDLALARQWIEAGCLMQVTAQTLAAAHDPDGEAALKRWAQGGFIHLLGSDGHGIDHRRPELAAGFHKLVTWVGHTQARQIAYEGGAGVLQGQPLEVPPRPATRGWLARLFGR